MEENNTKRRGRSAETARRMAYSKINILCLVIVALFLAAAIFAPVIAPYGYSDMVDKSLLPPSGDHWFGTDDFGRDYFSRVVVSMYEALDQIVKDPDSCDERESGGEGGELRFKYVKGFGIIRYEENCV